MNRPILIIGKVAGLLTAVGIVATAWAAPNSATATRKDDPGFQTAAPAAILIEAESGTVLY